MKMNYLILQMEMEYHLVLLKKERKKKLCLKEVDSQEEWEDLVE